MRCVHTTERYTEWREGKLSVWQSLMYRLHLVYCPGCPIYVKQMDETVKTLQSLDAPDAEPPASLLEKLKSG